MTGQNKASPQLLYTRNKFSASRNKTYICLLIHLCAKLEIIRMVALLNAVHTAPVRAPVVVGQRARAALRSSALPVRRSVAVRASAEEEVRQKSPASTLACCLA